MEIKQRLPERPAPFDEILAEMASFRQNDADWKGGKVWSLVYHAGDDFSDFLKRAHNLYFSENALNPMAFKSLRRMEAEIVRMTASMLHGDQNVAGTMTTGGTESILMAIKAYRERGKTRGITRPELVLPESAHVAFEKAGHYFNVKLRKAPLDRDFKVDVDAMRRLINRNTIALVASAPQYPQGVIDPIEAVGALALEKKLPLHVDSCIGGFVLPWIEKLGRKVPLWDFRVPGVTSISADVHKYGFSPKGASVVVYRSMDYLKHQFFISTDWSGGVYASATMPGTRPGGAISAAWAAMVGMGEEGYLKHTAALLEAFDTLRSGIPRIPGLVVVGEPEASLIAWSSEGYERNEPRLDVYAVAAQMEARGWTVDRQQYPASVHLTVTSNHRDVASAYLADLREAAAYVAAHPEEKSDGNAAMYGLMAKVPVRALVRQGVQKVMESLYAPNPKFEPDPEDAHLLPPPFRRYEPHVIRAIDTLYDWRMKMRRRYLMG
jgi:glutamate/tyrosine decarboxylase-like PLP-dependent enzyme